jgi:hypothetical protein
MGSMIGKLSAVSVGDNGTIPYNLHTAFQGAPGNIKLGLGDDCQMWFVNLWAMGWSFDM